MKKLLVTLGVLALAGFGCAPNDPASLSTPSNSPVPVTQPMPVPGTSTPDTSVVNVTPGSLQQLPDITPPTLTIDDSTWIATTTRTGVTIKAPVKGTFAPTWTFDVLSKDDAHLQGDCYVTTSVAYQKTAFTNHTSACQTTTAFSAEAGTRTDYFVFRRENNIYLITFTKVHGANYNQNDYSATIDHAINLIR